MLHVSNSDFSICPRLLAIRIKRKGDSRSPCLIPFDGENVEDNVSLIKIEKKVEEVREMIH